MPSQSPSAVAARNLKKALLMDLTSGSTKTKDKIINQIRAIAASSGHNIKLKGTTKSPANNQRRTVSMRQSGVK